MSKKTLRRWTGIETDHLETAYREILEVDHGGNFLTSPATLELLHAEVEHFYPPVFNRGGPDATSMLQCAHERVEALLASWENPVPEHIRDELYRLLRA